MSEAFCQWSGDSEATAKLTVSGETGSARWLAMACCTGFAFAAALLAGMFPIHYSIAIVFLFAGPHNWIEAKYFLTRLPPRLGKLRSFFIVAVTGSVGLTIAHAALPWVAGRAGWSTTEWHFGTAIWSSVLIAWITVLIFMRSRQGPRRDWGFAAPCAFLVLSAAWLQPGLVLLSLVYLHPLVGLWILDREIRLNRPSFHSAYRVCLAIVPLLLIWLALRLARAEVLTADSEIASWLVMQAGGSQLSFVSSRFLVASHAFLESIHYGVWLIAIPMANPRVLQMSWEAMPAARHPGGKRNLVTLFLCLGVFLVLSLWAAFCFDYATTRNLYFNVAMIHVLTEIPFLLRLL